MHTVQTMHKNDEKPLYHTLWYIFIYTHNMAFSENYGGHDFNVESQQTMDISNNFCLSKMLRNTIDVFLIA